MFYGIIIGYSHDPWICNTWYHRVCMGMSSENYNEITNNKDEKWICPTCDPKNYSFHSNSEHILPPTAHKTVRSLDELKTMLASCSEAEWTEENKLQISAEIGSKLNLHNAELQKENSILTQKMNSMEAKIEDLFNTIDSLTVKEGILLDNLHAIERQLEREINLRIEVQKTFEGHDEKQLQTIDSQERKIVTLEKELLSLRSEAGDIPSTIRQDASSERSFPTISPNAALVTIKNEVRTMKADLLALEKNYQSLYSFCHDSHETLKERNPEQSPTTNCTFADKSIMNKPNDEPSNKSVCNPPCNARIRPLGQTVEEFYHQHLDFYINLMTVVAADDFEAFRHETLEHDPSVSRIEFSHITPPVPANNVLPAVNSNPSAKSF
ncbi:hypothetical protein J6590_031389 [Homalodisca vitripennis]|nr:hypothetical protein J6590_031389 [Homalodisca vitripennis]